MNAEDTSIPNPLVVYGAGYILANGFELQDGIGMQEFADAFPFFKTAGWALVCVNIEHECDGFGSSFITHQIQARIGKYLSEWEGFSFNTIMGPPKFPDWILGTYDEETRCVSLYAPS